MPTPCSMCGNKTAGTCESCRKVDAVLTPERVADIWSASPLGSKPSHATLHFARTISREVVAILAQKPLSDDHILNLWYRAAGISEAGSRRLAFGRALEQAHGIISTPAASGIGESGGE